MRTRFEEQLKQLGVELTIMGNMIEVAIQRAIEAFFNQDVEKAQSIVEEDDAINQQQKAVEGICYQLLIQQQPVAKDLRVITAAMKMVTDMERIGDHASDIAELTIEMASSPYKINEEHIKKMATETTIMLLKAVEAYVERDMLKAQSVIDHDEIVDDLFTKVKEDLIDAIHESPENGLQCADLLMVNKYLERIGDHATNIAEWVIFSLDNKNK